MALWVGQHNVQQSQFYSPRIGFLWTTRWIPSVEKNGVGKPTHWSARLDRMIPTPAQNVNAFRFYIFPLSLPIDFSNSLSSPLSLSRSRPFSLSSPLSAPLSLSHYVFRPFVYSTFSLSISFSPFCLSPSISFVDLSLSLSLPPSRPSSPLRLRLRLPLPFFSLSLPPRVYPRWCKYTMLARDDSL